MKHYVTIKDGKIDNPATVKKAFNLSDGYYELEIKKKNKRSLQQNAYWWGVVVAMVHEGLRDMGNDVSLQETHEFLKMKFNTKSIVNTIVGEVSEIPKSTTGLSKVEFNELIERVQQFAAEYLNLNIPSPNEQMTFSYGE